MRCATTCNDEANEHEIGKRSRLDPSCMLQPQRKHGPLSSRKVSHEISHSAAVLLPDLRIAHVVQFSPRATDQECEFRGTSAADVLCRGLFVETVLPDFGQAVELRRRGCCFRRENTSSVLPCGGSSKSRGLGPDTWSRRAEHRVRGSMRNSVFYFNVCFAFVYRCACAACPCGNVCGRSNARVTSGQRRIAGGRFLSEEGEKDT